jgi:4'-phosphopantetheinyl transferase
VPAAAHSPGWLSVAEAEVPAGDAWLGARERAVLDGLRIAPRRASWRLGRWAAKRALSAWLEVGEGAADSDAAIELLAAADRAPEAWVEGQRCELSISISHRSGRAVAVVAGAGTAIGCDLELIEPRSDAFVREWLSTPEQDAVARVAPGERPLATNLVWTAKEAAAKVRRAGLRLDVRGARVDLGSAELPADLGTADLPVDGDWRPLHVVWSDGHPVTGGWWRAADGWVVSVAGEPGVGQPVPLLRRPR